MRAVVLNSGGANACTGPDGFADTHHTAERLAKALSVSAGEVAVCSTGLIGERLPMDRLLPGVDAAAAARLGGRRRRGGRRDQDHRHGAEDVQRSQAPGTRSAAWARERRCSSPALATMLVVLTTDADLPAGELDAALRTATAVTFDRLDTDGCMSTNDTVLLLASGASGVRPDPGEFTALLTEGCADLARQMQLDAEGAGKAIDIEVTGAASERDAVTVGRAIARCNLLKCAIAGEDPNWGRVLAAVGTTDADFEPDRLGVAINGVWVCRNGYAAEDRSGVDLRPRDVRISVDLAAGPHAATIRTTDLTEAYVHENSAYST